MTSSSMPEQEHRRSSPPETVTMASDGPQPQLTGLGDTTTGRSDAATMVTGGSGDDEEDVMRAQGRPLGDFILIGTPCGKLLLAPTPLASRKQDEEVSAPLHRPAENMPAAANGGKKQCVECGATETPQWRMQPIGLGALCNACRIRLRPAEALWELVNVHIPPPATARTPEPAPAPEKKIHKRKRKPRRHLPKSSKQCHHCKTASTPQWRMGPTGPSTLCDTCGVHYRRGRLLEEEEYRPAASPNLKPSSAHACKHHEEVLQPCQKKHKSKEQQHQPPPQPAAAMQPRVGDGMEQRLPPPPAAQARAADELPTGEPISLDQLLLDAIDRQRKTAHIVYGVGGDLQMGDPSSLDHFLFNGPAAPPLIDDDDDDEEEDFEIII